jgi:hypothetical protein
VLLPTLGLPTIATVNIIYKIPNEQIPNSKEEKFQILKSQIPNLPFGRKLLKMTAKFNLPSKE